MPNLKYLRLLPMALTMATIAAWAQAPVTLTVTEVLKQQQAALIPPPVLKVERVKTAVTLDAVYGLSDQLRFDVTIDGVTRNGLAIGDAVKGFTGSCTVLNYSAASQCLQLGQASRSEICPAKACWTGVRPSAKLLSSTAIPAISGLQPLPPLPLQAAQPTRSAQGGVISIAPVPATTAIHAPQTAGAKP